MLNHTLIVKALELDFVELYGIERELFRAFARWFWPLHEEYVARVTEWQIFLCSQGWANADLCVGPLLVRYGVARRWGSGYCLSNPRLVQFVHQIALLFWKEEVSVAPNWDDYVQRITMSGRPDISHPLIGKLARWLKTTLGEAPSWDEIEGKAGSGTTADRRTLRDRWFFNRPPLGMPVAFYRFNAHDDTPVHTDAIVTARAASVPKNRKSARIVASEPSAALFAQLGVKDALARAHRHVRQIRADDQDAHRNFLRAQWKHCVTVDLSDASDYISIDLVNEVFPQSWVDIMNSCRSQAVRLPDGSVHRLATYAPMGNGFCFRVLSLVCGGLLAILGLPWSDVGDDMICVDRAWPLVRSGLEACGLVINYNKTCGGPRYLETCGLELLDGVDVTPLKLKKVLMLDGLECDLAAAARAEAKGLHYLARFLMRGVPKGQTRYNYELQRTEWRLPAWVTAKLEVAADGWAGMYRWLRQRGTEYRNETAEYTKTRPGFRWWSPGDLESLGGDVAATVVAAAAGQRDLDV